MQMPHPWNGEESYIEMQKIDLHVLPTLSNPGLAAAKGYHYSDIMDQL